jgi:hypothetical protein
MNPLFDGVHFLMANGNCKMYFFSQKMVRIGANYTHHVDLYKAIELIYGVFISFPFSLPMIKMQI